MLIREVRVTEVQKMVQKKYYVISNLCYILSEGFLVEGLLPATAVVGALNFAVDSEVTVKISN